MITSLKKIWTRIRVFNIYIFECVKNESDPKESESLPEMPETSILPPEEINEINKNNSVDNGSTNDQNQGTCTTNLREFFD